MSIRIHKLGSEDIGLILDLDRLVFPADAPPMLMSAEWWVAAEYGGEHGPREVGYAGAAIWSGALYLCRAGVLPSARGQGLQRRFIRVRERWARKAGLLRAYSYTHHASLSSANNLIACGYKLHKPDGGGPDRCITPTWLHWGREL
jgi:GNAT superfamily N-acetyltransferase